MDDRPAAALGLRAQKGGAVAVALTLDGRAPRVLISTMVRTHGDGDRLSLEPYGVAAAMPRGPNGEASAEAALLVGEGRRRQDALAAEALDSLLRRVEAGGAVVATAGLLVNRAGWVTDLLDYSLGWPEHVPVAEGLAVRDALRSGLRECGIALVEADEKGLPALAEHVLGLGAGAIEAELKALGAQAGKPWRKEQKLAALAAWVTLVAAQVQLGTGGVPATA